MAASSGMDTLKRVRKIRERLAELDWMEAQAAQRDQENRTLENDKLAEASHSQVGDRSEDMVLHHLYALQLEVTARRDIRELATREAKTLHRQRQMRSAQLETRVVESVAESRREETAIEDARPAQAELDEMGMKAWWRRGAS